MLYFHWQTTNFFRNFHSVKELRTYLVSYFGNHKFSWIGTLENMFEDVDEMTCSLFGKFILYIKCIILLQYCVWQCLYHKCFTDCDFWGILVIVHWIVHMIKGYLAAKWTVTLPVCVVVVQFSLETIWN